ncbi:hypothetical protein [Sulfitobacter sp. M13]
MAAELPNKRHEEFAKLIAGGVKQRDAYARAGYAATNNRAAASRLAKKVAARVEELRNAEYARIFANMCGSSGGSLADLGITLGWVADQYKIVATRALAGSDFKASTDATRSLEKMIRDAETQGSDAPKKTSGQKIDIDHMMAILAKLAAPTAKIVDDQKHPGEDSREVSTLARNRAHRAAARDEQ